MAERGFGDSIPRGDAAGYWPGVGGINSAIELAFHAYDQNLSISFSRLWCTPRELC